MLEKVKVFIDALPLEEVRHTHLKVNHRLSDLFLDGATLLVHVEGTSLERRGDLLVFLVQNLARETQSEGLEFGVLKDLRKPAVLSTRRVIGESWRCWFNKLRFLLVVHGLDRSLVDVRERLVAYTILGVFRSREFRSREFNRRPGTHTIRGPIR